MNLINTLLVYMTLLVSSSVQQMPAMTPKPLDPVTALPKETATPYVAPTAAPTAMVVPPPVTTAPVNPSNVILAIGDRGENVRVMQRRLIELGYLTGKADGIFGKNTKKAVERFQNFNALKVDGVAGPKTLQKLYHDTNVVAAPAGANPTTTPASATPRPAVIVQVPISYTDETGKVLYNETLSFQQGVTTYRADDGKVPTGYTLKSSRDVVVTIDAAGKATPSAILFVYTAPQPAATPTETAAPATETPTETPAPATETPTETATPATETPTETATPATETPTETPTPATEAPTETATPATEEPTETATPATEEPTETAAPTAAPYSFPTPVSGEVIEKSEVLTAPSAGAYGIENAATEDGMTVRVYGKVGEQLLIGFTMEKGFSVGYVNAAAISVSGTAPELSFMSESVELAKTAALTDDPDASSFTMATLSAGGRVKLLGILNNWAYVETAIDGKTARGFIDKTAVGR